MDTEERVEIWSNVSHGEFAHGSEKAGQCFGVHNRIGQSLVKEQHLFWYETVWTKLSRTGRGV